MEPTKKDYENFHKLLEFFVKQWEDELHGILFDGAWLWEEYLNKIFVENGLGFTHAENKIRKNPIYLFNDNTYKRFPDFYKSNFILDAKYKHLNKLKIDRNDMHQIISYMYVKEAELGGLIYPVKENVQYEKSEFIGILNGYGGNIKIWSLTIPEGEASTFDEFKTEICKNEKKLIKELKEL